LWALRRRFLLAHDPLLHGLNQNSENADEFFVQIYDIFDKLGFLLRRQQKSSE
jgi:hypothetical protein